MRRRVSLLAKVFTIGSTISFASAASASTCQDVAYAENQLSIAQLSRSTYDDGYFRSTAEADKSYCISRSGLEPTVEAQCEMEYQTAIDEINNQVAQFEDGINFAANDLALARAELTEVCT